MIEGKSYDLKPYDIVLVRHGDIHRLSVDNSKVYERIIVYISPNFMDAYHTDSYDLSYCFHKAELEHSNVLRIPSLEKSSLFRAITRHLKRAARKNRLEFIDTRDYNSKIQDILAFINENLSEDLSIDRLSGKFYISKYYMMRLFKQETGYTLGQYITQKRLLLAKELILSGVPGTQACFDCGFRDYSTFSRAYKKQFQESPRETLTFS